MNSSTNIDFKSNQIYESFNWLFRKELFGVADDLMIRMIDNTNDVDVFFRLLLITLPVKNKLLSRDYLYKVAKGFIQEKHPTEWEELLRGLT